MENTPSRIAADILMAALESKTVQTSMSPEVIANAFTVIHQAVFDAAKKDTEANLSTAFQ